MLDHLSGTGADPVPSQVWKIALASDLSPGELFRVGVAAHKSGVEYTRTAYRSAIESGHSGVTAQAAFNLGNHEKYTGNVEAARSAYQITINSDHSEAAPKAAFNLINLEP